MRLRLCATLVALTMLPAFPAKAQSTAHWLDRSFGTNGTVTTAIGPGHENVRAVAIQADGKIVVAGYSHNGTTYDFAVVRYNPNGTLDASFGTGGKVTTAIGPGDAHIHGMALQPDGKIVVAGHSHAKSDNNFTVVRYNPNGSLDVSFGSNGTGITDFESESGSGYAYAFAAAVQPDGKIVVAGTGPSGTGGSDNDVVVVRYNPNGSLDASFGTGGTVTTAIGAGNDQCQAMALQPDGKIVVAGYKHHRDRRRFRGGAVQPGRFAGRLLRHRRHGHHRHRRR